MALSNKNVFRISCGYGLILCIINFLGAVIPISFQTPVENTSHMNQWLKFLDTYSTAVNIVTVFDFLVPTILCASYIIFAKKEKYEKRFINLPIVYSTIGMTGWIMHFISEIFFCIAAKNALNIEISSILGTSLVFTIQEAFFTFTLSYMILDSLHRKKFLPKYFPTGLSKFNGLLKPSVHALFIIYYISVVLFPIFYLVTNHIIVLHNNGLKIDFNSIFVLATIITIGYILTCLFTHYFSTPLRKLKEGTEKIKLGNYTDKISIVSNDAFGLLSDTFNEMTSAIDMKNKRIIAIQDSVIRGMAVMVESRDNSTGGHINRTSDCVRVFVDKLKSVEKYQHISESFWKSIIKAAPMHDLGKIAVDDRILRKPGKFTDEEYEIMKTHSKEGAVIVSKVLHEVDDEEFKKIAVNVAHYHHEKWNGQGYPERIKGEEIPFEARIMALADVFDALVSKRCYKDSFSYDKAFQIIEESLGSHFDSELGRIFIECRSDLENLYNSYF